MWDRLRNYSVVQLTWDFDTTRGFAVEDIYLLWNPRLWYLFIGDLCGLLQNSCCGFISNDVIYVKFCCDSVRAISMWCDVVYDDLPSSGESILHCRRRRYWCIFCRTNFSSCCERVQYILVSCCVFSDKFTAWLSLSRAPNELFLLYFLLRPGCQDIVVLPFLTTLPCLHRTPCLFLLWQWPNRFDWVTDAQVLVCFFFIRARTLSLCFVLVLFLLYSPRGLKRGFPPIAYGELQI